MTWKKGQSGNPEGGSRVKVPAELISFFREKSVWAGQKLIDLINAKDTAETVKYKCLELVLAYGLGKPKQVMQMSGTMEVKDASSARTEISSAITRLAAREAEERDTRTLN